MKLKKPLTLDSEACYLEHCKNIAIILAYNQGLYAQERIERYIKITGAELMEENPNKKFHKPRKSKGEKKLCPRCGAEVEFAQDPLRICTRCGWRGDFTKLEEI